jgi:hypothetical protein
VKSNGDFGMIRGIKGTYSAWSYLICIMLIISDYKNNKAEKIILLWHRYDW